VEPAAVALIGGLIGLAAHDLAVQGLSDDIALRPFVGICPECHQPRGWTKTRCPNCSRRIEREPIVAITSALVAYGFYLALGVSWLLIPYLGFLGLSMALVVTDLEEMRIVDRLNYRGTLALAVTLAVVALAMGETGSLGRALLGALAYFGGSTLMWLLVKGRGFGAGDVKLAPQLGLFTAYLSWGTLGWAVFLTAVIGGVVGVGMILAGAAKMKTELPYGPPMVIGAWLAVVLAGIGSFPLPS
jgi:leader peptidase (prepilin peptidase) / N-methyltransferase